MRNPKNKPLVILALAALLILLWVPPPEAYAEERGIFDNVNVLDGAYHRGMSTNQVARDFVADSKVFRWPIN